LVPILPILAAVALTPEQTTDIRCVAVIGIAARTDPALVLSGREFAARVGAAVMDKAAASREDVADVFLSEGQQVVKTPADRAETERCTARMVEWLSR